MFFAIHQLQKFMACNVLGNENAPRMIRGALTQISTLQGSEKLELVPEELVVHLVVVLDFRCLHERAQ